MHKAFSDTVDKSSAGTVQSKVAIVVLNWNGWPDTVECLESLQTLDYPDYQVIVVDNGSTDGSVGQIKKWAEGKLEVRSEFVKYAPHLKPVYHVEYDRQTAEGGGVHEYEEELARHPPPQRMVLIQTESNLGFSGGNNIGAKYGIKAGCDYVVLLNNDAIVASPDFVDKIVEVFGRLPEAKVVGPKVLTEDGGFDGPYVYETFWGELMFLSLKNLLHKLIRCPPVYIDLKAVQNPRPTEVYKISGACMAFDAPFLNQIDYLDDNVWLSCEEAIISEKVRSRGKKVYFQPLATVIHKKASAPRELSKWSDIVRNHLKQRRYFLRNYRRYGMVKSSLIALVHQLRIGVSYLQSQRRKY